jgi:predicted TIM-barrel fold metal-dependent hydrolase
MKKEIIFILIIIMLAILVFSFSYKPTKDYEIYDVHEQIQFTSDVPKFLNAMDKAKVDKIILLGTPDATFIYQEGFEGHHENNEEIMKMVEEHPTRFIAFPTIDPRNSSELRPFQDYIERGAKGLRLFSGQHAWFYRFIGPVNRTEQYPILEYCEQNNIPVMWNMNPGKETLQEEFEQMLKKYPNLKVICPHFCLSSINDTRFQDMMDNYPNLYTDISFGHFFEDGLKRISRNTTKFTYLFNKYQDRIMFGIDLVITSKTGTDSEWIYNITMCYRDMLEKEKYDCRVKVGSVFNTAEQNLNGLALNKTILNKIYSENPKRFLGET